MSKYPIIKIKEPVTDAVGDGFELEGSCKPSFFRGTTRIFIGGNHPPYAKGDLIVYEGRQGPWDTDPHYEVIETLGPDVKKEDVIPQYQERLKDRLAELARG